MQKKIDFKLKRMQFSNKKSESKKSGDTMVALAPILISRAKNKLLHRGKNGNKQICFWAYQNVPILFILISFLIIANIECDKIGSNSVQKFHPNGRYGRRSVGDFATEPHSELGKLVYDENNKNELQSLGSILRQISQFDSEPKEKSLLMNKLVAASMDANNRDSGIRSLYSNGEAVANVDLEMSKLLKCNYTGLANFYRCDLNNINIKNNNNNNSDD